MDPDFIREFSVLVGFAGLYIFGSIFLLKGHTTDLSAMHGHGATTSEGGAPTPQRLNRRRKAIAREQASKSAE